MIRCSHCGKLAPTGAVSCQHCGMPLVSGGNGLAGAGESAQQDQLPAWLESLRAHERPVPSGQENRQPFSLDELVDEDSMPSWMRQDRRKVPENGNSDSFPALPAVSADEQSESAGGFQAGSLIDERSLPAWMREGQASGQAGAAQNVSAHSLVDQQNLPAWIKDLNQASQAQAQAPSAPAHPYGLPTQTQAPARGQYGLPGPSPVTSPSVPSAPRVPQTPPAASQVPLAQGFSANELLDVQAMPDWMKGSQGPGAPPTRPVPTGQGFSAGELIDQRSVPQWMKDLQGQEQSDPQSAMGVPVNGSGQMRGTQGQQGTGSDVGMPAGSLLDQSSMPSWLKDMQPGGSQAQTPPPVAQQGFSAGALVDTSAMPPWLKEIQPGGPQAQTPPPVAQDMGQGFSANALLDANTMPPWMREGAQGTQGSPMSQPAAQNMEQGFSANSLLDASAMPAWMREGAQAQGPQAAGQGMAAGSLVDMNSMPAWLRNSDSGQSAAGGRPGQVPARPVPSRPRAEHAAQEQSEVAANVFASMLGVAASAPALPGQEATLGVAQGQGQPMAPSLPPFQQAQPLNQGWQQPGMNQYNQGAAPAWQMGDAAPSDRPSPAPTYAPMGQGGAGYGQNAGYGQQGAEQPAWSYSAADRTALGVTSGAGTGPANDPYASQAQPVGNKKKGFFDSIRDFFSK